MSKSQWRGGLDQLGPTQWWTGVQMPQRTTPKGLNARAHESMLKREVKVTLSDHLMSSDEIKTKEDT